MEIKLAKGTNIKKGLPPNKRWIVMEKVDGVRRYFRKSAEGKVRAFSNSGIEDPWLRHICKVLESSIFPNDMVYDTELVDRQSYLERIESFRLRAISTGKAAQQYPDNKEDLMALIFEMYRPGSTSLCSVRSEMLTELFAHRSVNSPISMIMHLGVVDSEDIDTIYQLANWVTNNNGEGLVLMDLDAMHIPGRSKSVIKVKPTITEDIIGIVVDYEIAKKGTKIEGGIATLICKVEGCTVPVRVGSGFSYEERKEIAKLGKDVIGRRIEIDAFGKTSNSEGTRISLSMPIFKRLLNN